jgi:hypothetical protein
MLTDTIRARLAETPASTSRNLRGFEFDLSYWLEQLDLFTSIRTRRPGDQLCMITADCTLRSPGAGHAEATKAVADAWEKELAYGFFSAYEVTNRPDGADIAFVTSTGKGAGEICVTGVIRIRIP